MPTLRELLASRLRDALLACDLDPARADVSQAADARFGDYQANAAMVLAKEKKRIHASSRPRFYRSLM